MDPLVSVIVTCFNKEKFIRDTLRSVTAQTYANWELLIIDDASTDSSPLILTSLATDPRIRLFIEHKNKGANFCRNKGLQASKGTYVIFLDGDDLLRPFCLESRVTLMKKNPSTDFSVHAMDTFVKTPGDHNGAWIPKSRNPLRDFLQHNLPWQTMQPIWKKEFLIKLGGFDADFVRLQDVELHTRALLQPSVKYVLFPGTPDCSYRIDEQRLNYNYALFLKKWVQGALSYYHKFNPLVPLHLRKYLTGTLFQTYVHLLLARKTGKIPADQFNQLEKEIRSNLPAAPRASKAKTIFRLARMYNLAPFRIPGLNVLLKKILL